MCSTVLSLRSLWLKRTKHDLTLDALGLTLGEETAYDQYSRVFQQFDVSTELCASLPGTFDVERLKPQLAAAKNFLELNSMLKAWR